MATKLKLFIGSSVEGLESARAIQENLERDADCTLWEQGVFGLSRSTFEQLLKKLSSFDCAVFVFSPDDKLMLRREKKLAVRDNVLFELGVFCGRLGEGRVFVAAPYDIKSVRLPTDLLGFSFAGYQAKRTDGNLTAALGSACNKIRRELRDLTASGSRSVPPMADCSFFSQFTNVFPSLLQNAQHVTLYFIHSRRWRENHYDHIVEFLQRPRTHLTVFLPNEHNTMLINAIQAHFSDGPAIPGLITDAFAIFRKLQRRFSRRVVIRRFNTYPTYSFYKFDDEIVVAAYPTTPRKRDVPAFRLNTSHPYAHFVLEDMAELTGKYRRRHKP